MGNLKEYSPFVTVNEESLSKYLDRQRESVTVVSIEVYECVHTLTKKVEWV